MKSDNFTFWLASNKSQNSICSLTGTFLNIDGRFAAGYIPPVIAGLSKPSTYGEILNPIIDDIITPLGRGYLNYTNTNCQTEDLLYFSGKSLLSPAVQSLGPELVRQPTIASILEQNVLGANTSATPIAPIYAYHSTNDEVIPYANASAAVNSWCDQGASVYFLTYGAGGHDTTEITNIPNAIQYTINAFNGDIATTGCSGGFTLNLSTPNPLAWGVQLEPILTHLIDVLEDLGPEDENVQKNIATLSKTVST